MSAALQEVIELLLGDLEFVASFKQDPEGALQNFDLTEDERQILLAGNAAGLEQLGVDSETAVGALSGAHSQRCPKG